MENFSDASVYELDYEKYKNTIYQQKDKILCDNEIIL
jgi:hypothetical protein